VSHFYLSFADYDPPKGRGFVGATIIKAATPELAVARADALGINPKNVEIAIVRLAVDVHTSPEYQVYFEKFVPREVVFAGEVENVPDDAVERTVHQECNR